MISLSHILKIHTFQIYAIIFGLTRFVMDDPWLHFTFCKTQAECDVTVMPSVTSMDWLRWWYNHAAHLISSSTALAFLTNVIEKLKSTPPSVNNQWKTISIEEKLDVISRLEKGERIVDICRNIRLAHSSIRTICDNADKIKESAKSGTKVFVCIGRLPPSYQNEPYQKLWMWVSYIFIALALYKHIV
jgi:hypothetical protein